MSKGLSIYFCSTKTSDLIFAVFICACNGGAAVEAVASTAVAFAPLLALLLLEAVVAAAVLSLLLQILSCGWPPPTPVCRLFVYAKFWNCLVSAREVCSNISLLSCSTVLNKLTPRPRFSSAGLNSHMLWPLKRVGLIDRVVDLRFFSLI